MARLDHLAELIGLPHIQHLALIGADLGHDMRRGAEPAIGKGGIAPDQFDDGHFGGAERDRGVGLELR